jgi:hypothetical protein
MVRGIKDCAAISDRPDVIGAARSLAQSALNTTAVLGIELAVLTLTTPRKAQ